MKTETELKETWCPYGGYRKFIAPHGTVIGQSWDSSKNGPPDPRIRVQCIGFACSQCMDCGPAVEMFDPRDRYVEIDVPMTIEDAEAQRPEGDGWLRSGYVWTRETGERYAYCGRNTGEALRQEVARGLSQLMDAIMRINPN